MSFCCCCCCCLLVANQFVVVRLGSKGGWRRQFSTTLFDVQHWTWLDQHTIGLVTDKAIFHWLMEEGMTTFTCITQSSELVKKLSLVVYLFFLSSKRPPPDLIHCGRYNWVYFALQFYCFHPAWNVWILWSPWQCCDFHFVSRYSFEFLQRVSD